MIWIFASREGRWQWRQEDDDGGIVQSSARRHTSDAARVEDAERHGYAEGEPLRHVVES